jgi:hypothetical protein
VAAFFAVAPTVISGRLGKIGEVLGSKSGIAVSNVFVDNLPRAYLAAMIIYTESLQPAPAHLVEEQRLDFSFQFPGLRPGLAPNRRADCLRLYVPSKIGWDQTSAPEGFDASVNATSREPGARLTPGAACDFWQVRKGQYDARFQIRG